MNKRYIYTNGTTLGADDGIGIALILAMFDKVDKNIEGLFTTSEEVDMSGAKHFDASILTGKYLINLDGFDKDTIINKTAAFYDLEIYKKISMKKSIYNNTYKIEKNTNIKIKKIWSILSIILLITFGLETGSASVSSMFL